MSRNFASVWTHSNYILLGLIQKHLERALTCPNLIFTISRYQRDRSSPSEVFLEKDVLNICSKFTGEHTLYWIALRYRCSPVNLLHIFRTFFLRTSFKGCFWRKVLPYECHSLLTNHSYCRKPKSSESCTDSFVLTT